jgi:hypothetical protein
MQRNGRLFELQVPVSRWSTDLPRRNQQLLRRRDHQVLQARLGHGKEQPGKTSLGR